MEQITSNTLEVKSELPGGKVICVCKVCGTEDVYDKAYITSRGQECRTCKAYKSHKDTVGRTYALARQIEMLLKKQVKIKEGKLVPRKGDEYISTLPPGFEKLPIGKVYGDYKIIGYIGRYGTNGYKQKPKEVVYQCIKCGNYRVLDIKSASTMTSLICGSCNRIKREAADRVRTTIAEIKLTKRKAAERQLQREEQKKEKLEQREIERANRQIEKEQKKQAEAIEKEQEKREKLALKEEKKRENFKETLKSRYPNSYIHLKPLKSSEEIEAVMICKKCGTVTPYSKHLRGKGENCPGCEKMKLNPFYKGLCMKDYSNTVFNGLRIIKQYVNERGFMCDAVCRYCGKEFNNVAVYDVIMRELYCDCKYSVIDIYCPSCGKPIAVTKDDIAKMKTEGIICKCGCNIKKSEILNEVVIEDTSQTMRDKAKAAGEAFKAVGNVEICSDTQLIREREPLYAGTDGKMYYRCTCMKHNTTLILSEEEIENYEHEQCMDSRQHLITHVNTDNLRL